MKMKRLIILLGVVCLVFLFGVTDPAFARYNNTGMGGLSLWTIIVGVVMGGGAIFLLVVHITGSVQDRLSETKEDKEKRKKEKTEKIDKEKEEKGLLRYYGEPVFNMFLPSLAIMGILFFFWVVSLVFG